MTTRPAKPISRRTALAGLGVGGVALALGASTVDAQQATPAPAPATETDVVYGKAGGQDLLLDVHRLPAHAEPRPAAILIHGGGLVVGVGGPHEMSDAALGLAEAGYVAFNVGYRLYSNTDGSNPWPAQLDDVQRAVRWIRANAATYGVDPERIGAFGWSSGGQLAAFLGTRDTRDNGDPALAGFSSRVTCVVTLGGVFDMTIRYDNANDNRVDAEVLGGSIDAPPDQAAYLDFSPMTFVDENSAPFLIFQEGDDSIVPVEHSQRMLGALQAAGVEVIYAWFPNYNHLSWRYWKLAAAETLAFLGRHLDPDGTSP